MKSKTNLEVVCIYMAPYNDCIGTQYVLSPSITPDDVVKQYRDQAAGYDEK